LRLSARSAVTMVRKRFANKKVSSLAGAAALVL